MTQEEIIEMVMQIGGCDRPEDDSPALKMFEAFAKLVAEKAIKEALAQEQEPVGQLLEDAFGRGQVMWFNKPKDESMLYTTPQSEKYPQIAINPEIVGYVAPQRTWVGLTNGEMIELSEMKLGSWDLILEVEDKLRSKNSE